MSFSLHPQLAADTIPLGDLRLCRVLLMNQKHFPWLILVPKKPDLRDLHDLSENDYATAMQEVRLVSAAMAKLFNADKMNVASLGNVVPQLHIHIIARHVQDKAWPKPVWNTVPVENYDTLELAATVDKLKVALGL